MDNGIWKEVVQQLCPEEAMSMDDYIRLMNCLPSDQPIIAEDYQIFYNQWLLQFPHLLQPYTIPSTTTTSARVEVEPSQPPPPQPQEVVIEQTPKKGLIDSILSTLKRELPIDEPIPENGENVVFFFIEFPPGFKEVEGFNSTYLPVSGLVSKSIYERFIQCEKVYFPLKRNPYPPLWKSGILMKIIKIKQPPITNSKQIQTIVSRYKLKTMNPDWVILSIQKQENLSIPEEKEEEITQVSHRLQKSNLSCKFTDAAHRKSRHDSLRC